MHFAFFGIETWMFASIFSHLTSKALTVVFQARGVIVYGSDQEVRCWKSLFVCLYGFIGTDGYHVMTSGKAQIIIQPYLIFVIFFTLAKFLEKKIYTKKTRKLRQNTQ